MEDATPSPSPYLQSHINHTLRVTTTDNRFFIGELKCTDRDRNLILHMTNEFRAPSATATAAAAAVAAEMKSRYIGLVVIPGHVIVRIEREVNEERDGCRGLASLRIGKGWC